MEEAETALGPRLFFFFLMSEVPLYGRNAAALELRFALTGTPKKGSLSIYSNDSYWGVIVPVFGNQSIGRIVRAGGTLSAFVLCGLL